MRVCMCVCGYEHWRGLLTFWNVCSVFKASMLAGFSGLWERMEEHV